jgi:hypothetical protein
LREERSGEGAYFVDPAEAHPLAGVLHDADGLRGGPDRILDEEKGMKRKERMKRKE